VLISLATNWKKKEQQKKKRCITKQLVSTLKLTCSQSCCVEFEVHERARLSNNQGRRQTTGKVLRL